MRQSLPGIISIHSVECSRLQPQLMIRAMAGLPNSVFAPTTKINFVGEPTCITVSEYNNGGRSEKTTIELNSTECLDLTTPLAFIVKCVNGDVFLVGKKEKQYPTISVNHTTGTTTSDASIYKIEISYIAPKTLIPIKF